MLTPQLPDNEKQRLEFIDSLDLLDTPRDTVYDHITQLACELFAVPIALVSIVDRDRQWFKSSVGLDVNETSREVSFCGHLVFSAAPLIVEDTLEDARFADNPLVTGSPRIRFYAGLPIMLKDDICVGSLCIIDTVPRQLSAHQVRCLEGLRDIVQDLFVIARESLIDPLTGAFNRRMLETTGDKLLSKSRRKASPLAIACVDIDFFKSVNDTYGHDAGDVVLMKFCDFLQQQLRNEDYLFRLGGEEFAILLPDTGSSAALRMCERLRASLSSTAFEYSGQQIPVSASIGVTECLSSDDTVNDVLKRADRGLYAAKAAGRDRVVVSP